ncbi:FAD-binding and (Fe-S)-binding domain-containing protein [Pseudomonas sp. RIT-PI-S]|uniref:FAD-binding and (Fe-S)-binding domain-containing protein n=1 Tax=Pseudomonas sp. RIT-PI-S TaxID=3035295 RepID=UPI0021D9BC40|nr:FAD-binding and (Fe-S)-binding domain-containing protein [Pseudomonas sp. RIT-PI-S]
MSLPVAFLAQVQQLIPAERCFDDPMATLAYGTDASFYRLLPKLVIRVESEAEVVGLLKAATAERVAVTFRAAGTSLSGQAISDSVLLVLGDHWNGREIRDHGQQIRLQPGVIGAQANAWLSPYGRKIGPDPASINACKIGGIVANNASGMCCGTAQNSYHTLAGLRLVLADGTCVDTENPASVAAFRHSHAGLLSALQQLAEDVRADEPLAARIRHKYRLKNTTGLSLNALVDYHDPLEILSHLLVGSEGTLGFISAVTYNTVVDLPHKASALIVFPSVEVCCNAVTALRSQPVAAVELLDRRSLRSVQHKPGMPAFVRELSPGACALLIECAAESPAVLQGHVSQAMAVLARFESEGEVEQRIDFTTDPVENARLWAIRKGTFPAVGAVRETGTTVIIEDVTFPVERLAEGVNRLLALLDKHCYDEAILFGHALEGNLHFVFTQGFSQPQEVARYDALMADVAQLVAVEFGGSLKAEHGTGRNMAPFVELEWGPQAYQLMWTLKRLLDPQGILNPDVVLSEDPQIHLKHLKPLPAADAIVDKCIECGFCEPVCPSHNLTLSPRQRIVIWRDIQAKKRDGHNTQALERQFQHHGIDTCAATGLCAQRCPVGINTGELVKKLRGTTAHHPQAASWAADHFATVLAGARWGLRAATGAQRLLGAPRMARYAAGLRMLSRGAVPQWSPALPQAQPPLTFTAPSTDDRPRVVYLAACVSRAMGPAMGDKEQTPLIDKTRQLLEKAGYQVVFPEGLDSLCCGQPFDSKGYASQGEAKRQELIRALLRASRGGLDPIYCDTSPCALRLLGNLADTRLDLHDPVRFTHSHLLSKLDFTPQAAPIAVHVTCSTQHLGQSQALLDIARRCSQEVIIPEGIHCCGFAGDKGFTQPELNAHALRSLKGAVQHCAEGISTSRTCEIGLSGHSGIDYHSLVYLVDRVTRAKQAPVENPPLREAPRTMPC